MKVTLSLVLFSLFILSSCKKEKPTISNPQTETENFILIGPDFGFNSLIPIALDTYPENRPNFYYFDSKTYIDLDNDNIPELVFKYNGEIENVVGASVKGSLVCLNDSIKILSKGKNISFEQNDTLTYDHLKSDTLNIINYWWFDGGGVHYYTKFPTYNASYIGIRVGKRLGWLDIRIGTSRSMCVLNGYYLQK